ncbi:MAG: hypothetical protein PHX57_06665 [Desulfobulbaceae bacterium]|nr:hypothetical protein [Desulfobulbaceae bacterium]
MTDEIIEVRPTIDHADSLYQSAVWVDEENNAYGPCRFGVPLGFELIEITGMGSMTPERAARRPPGPAGRGGYLQQRGTGNNGQ